MEVQGKLDPLTAKAERRLDALASLEVFTHMLGPYISTSLCANTLVTSCQMHGSHLVYTFVSI